MPTGFESFVFFAGKYLVECLSGLENSISDFIGTNLFLLVFFHSYNFHFGIFLDPQDRQLDLKRNCKVDADRVCNFSFRILLVLKISGLGFVGSKNSEFVFFIPMSSSSDFMCSQKCLFVFLFVLFVSMFGFYSAQQFSLWNSFGLIFCLGIFIGPLHFPNGFHPVENKKY